MGKFDINVAKKAHDMFTAAALKNDYPTIEKWVMKMFTPGFKYMEGKKTTSRAEWLMGLKQNMMQSKIVAFKLTADKAVTKMGKGMVMGKLMVKAKGKGADGKMHTFETNEKYTETWVWMNGMWMLDSVKSMGIVQMMDGKPMKAMKPMAAKTD